jgi:two-component system response regulator DesR
VGPPSDLSRLVLAVAAPERRWVLRRTFERTGLVEVVAEVDDGPSCLDAVLEHAPDFAVVELQHQDADELRLVRLVSQAGQKPSVVVLADVSDPHRLELVLRSGAAGVVRRDAPPYDVVRQVHAVLGLPRGTGWCPEPA